MLLRIKLTATVLMAACFVSACGGGSGGGSSTPTLQPTVVPSVEPTIEPTFEPTEPTPESTPEPTPAPEVSSLHSLADFPIGVAVAAGNDPKSLLSSSERQVIVTTHFNLLSAENIMKPQYMHPAENRYFWDEADALLAFAQANGLQLHGHTLVWHSQIASWMQEYSGSRAEWTAMMENHINAIVQHFEGDIVSWDVVNEAFNDSDGSYRESVWYTNIGEGYLAKAFIAARAADANVDLYYNDYNLSHNGAKLDGAMTMVDSFIANSTPIDGIGFQMHISLGYPTITQIQAAFAKVVARDLKVKITELDITVNGSEQLTTLTPAAALAQRERYRAVVKAYRDVVPAELRGGITVWGITDTDSWLPGFHNRDEWGLLFNGDYSPKQALQGFAEGLTGE